MISVVSEMLTLLRSVFSDSLRRLKQLSVKLTMPVVMF